MKKTVATAVLGFGVMVGSLVGGPLVGAAPAGGGQRAATANMACDCTIVYTTSDLNLRSGPDTSYKVIDVMPEGAKIQRYIQAGEENGFAKVYYDGNAGWASLDYLTENAGGSGSGGSGGFDPDAYDENLITDAGVITSFSVNFRTGPGTNYDIQDVLEEGEQVAYTDVVVNNFRYVWHAGYEGWVHVDYVAIDDGSSGNQDDAGPGVVEPGSTLTVTSDLNLRAKPNTSSKVVLVMPEGATVIAHAETENSFLTVTYNGVTGWAYMEYLSN